jgi:large repetitive protein
MKKLLLMWVFVTSAVALTHAQNGESNCNDNLDNDGDGLVDCRDCANKVCEVCNDGVDNDADGFIDCYDKECSVDAACNGFFIGKNLICEARPATFPPFAMTEDFRSPTGVTHHLSKILVADVDQDGKPEIISLFRNKRNEADADFTAHLNILSPPTNGGTEMTVKASRAAHTDGVYLQHEGDIATADVDRDGDAEIFVVSGTRGGTNQWGIMAYTFNKATQQLDKFWNGLVSTPNDPGNMGLADFDGDGKVELYARDRIYDAHTGVEMGRGNNLTGTDWRKESSGSTAVDILRNTDCADCQGLELVAGCRIYSVAINRTGTPTATITKVRERSEYFTRTGLNNESSTSVADFDLDGNLDVLAVGSYNTENNNTTVFYWNLHKGAGVAPAVNAGELKTFSESYTSQTGTFYAGGWINGAGRINIADIDGDGDLNAVYVSGRYLYALEDDPGSATTLKKFFREDVTEETSGITGCTLFDFNADGTSEIVYRDEETLFIFTTTYPLVNGSPDYNQAPIITKSSPVACKSRTYRDYPIVADVDADGSTEICVTCSTNTTSTAGKNLELYWDDKNDATQGDNGEARVMVFKSANVPWVPARRLWNQHGYFVVNVNDDLTIPTNQQAHQSVYARNVVCLNGRDSRPLNFFLNQAPFLNSQGCPSFAAPNLSFKGGLANIQVAPPTCPQQDFQITFEILNRGDVALTGKVPISFYNGNPQTASATKLLQVDLDFNNVLPGQSVKLENQTITGPGNNFPLYIVINHDGINENGSTLPITFPGTNFIECDYTDNIVSVPVVPGPAPLGVAVVKQNVVCDGGVTDPMADGEARAFVIGANNTEVVQNFTFVWSNGDFVNSPPDYSNNPANKTGSVYSGLAAGTYTVYATHNSIGCGSMEAKVVITDNPSPGPEVEIKTTDIVNPTSCKIDNGSLKATATGGSNNFSYQWYFADQIGTGQPLGSGQTINGLGGGDYAVVITDVATGCTDNDSQSLVAPGAPTVSADATDSDCSSTPTGEVFVTNTTNGVKYLWYDGDATTWFDVNEYKNEDELPAADFTGANYLNRSGGKYSVIAVNNNTKCLSLPVVEEVMQTTPPNVTVAVNNHQTSCDLANLNGEATATVVSGSSTYSYQWYNGSNTSSTGVKTANGTAANVKNLPVGTYSVVVTDNSTSCSVVRSVVIESRVNRPQIVNSGTTPNTMCSNNGSMEVDVEIDGQPADYSKLRFDWYEGVAVNSVKILADKDRRIENVPHGEYTVRVQHVDTKCYSDPVTDEILNNISRVNFNVSDMERPSDCNAGDGVLQFTLSPTNVALTVRWFRNVQNPVSPNTADEFTPTGPYDMTSGITRAEQLSDGYYTLLVTNPITACVDSVTQELIYENAPDLRIGTLDHITSCMPANDGSIPFTVEVTDPLKTINNYDILIYQRHGDPGSAPGNGELVYDNDPGTTGTPSGPIFGYNTLIYPSSAALSAEWYTIVVAEKLRPDCRVSKFRELIQVVDYPQLNLVSTPNVSCIPLASGQIAVTVTNNMGGSFDYSWTKVNSSNTYPNASTITGLNQGDYTVQVTIDNLTMINGGRDFQYPNGCASEATSQVFDMPTQISLTFNPNDVMTCVVDPLNPNGSIPSTTGSAIINSISKNGVNDLLGNYTVEWVSIQSGSTVATGTSTGNVLGVGEYLVRAIDDQIVNHSGCNTENSFVILDKTPETIDVRLTDFKKQEICITPSLGYLEVLAAGTGNTYSYSWTSTEPNFGNGSPVTTPRITNLTFVNSYTVTVTNNDNGCKAEETYTIDKLVNPVPVITSKTDLTNCVPLNGGLQAAVVDNQAPANYTFVWTYNDITNGNNIVNFSTTDSEITGLGVTTGIFVRAIDNEDPAQCISELTPIADILDLRIYPNVIASEVAPVTNCVNPFNGVASASVQGDVTSNYVFNWFEGSTVTNIPAFSGVEYGNLSSATYTVQAIHRITGCPGTDAIQITNQPIPVPMPAITILSHVTSCEPGNNGALAATVNGKIEGYTFDWYDGAAEKASADFVGDTYTNLVVGIYSVIATDNTTGCRSPLVSEELLFQPRYPDFEFITMNATCADPNLTNGQPNGAITLILLSDVEIASVRWEPIEGESLQMGTQFNEINLANAYPGKYLVTVTSSLGCETQKEVDLGTEIHPFNGVSRNRDGYNDIFYINCIENFPKNLVKIFNRAGTLVYEAEGYDNATTYFDGQSNKGVSLMGTNLPDGTYFYIIDKRDGSKPLAGYLEVVK